MDSRKLLVFSDTHGGVSSLRTVFNWAVNLLPPNDTLCAAAFLGDGISDLQTAASKSNFYCEWKIVKGNNDFGFSIPESAVMEFADHNFFLCHGHRHSLYGGFHSLVNAASKNNADIVLFGHTHVPSIKTADGVLLINPGSVGRPRSKIGATFAIIECVSGEPPDVKFYNIDHGKIREIFLF